MITNEDRELQEDVTKHVLIGSKAAAHGWFWCKGKSLLLERCQREGQLVAGAELWWLASILFGEDGVVGFLN
jgi:hypothetical protein